MQRFILAVLLWTCTSGNGFADGHFTGPLQVGPVKSLPIAPASEEAVIGRQTPDVDLGYWSTSPVVAGVSMIELTDPKRQLRDHPVLMQESLAEFNLMPSDLTDSAPTSGAAILAGYLTQLKVNRKALMTDDTTDSPTSPNETLKLLIENTAATFARVREDPKLSQMKLQEIDRLAERVVEMFMQDGESLGNTSQLNPFLGTSLTNDTPVFIAPLSGEGCARWRGLSSEECYDMLRLTSIVNWRRVYPGSPAPRDSALVTISRKEEEFDRICSGFKVASGFVITAAHCCPNDDFIIFSEYTNEGDRFVTETIKVEEAIYVEDTDAGQLCGQAIESGVGKVPAGQLSGYDIVLLKYISTSVSQRYQPIRIIDADSAMDKLGYVRLNGYGRNNHSAGAPADFPDLLMGDAPFKSFDCKELHPRLSLAGLEARIIEKLQTFPDPCAKFAENLVGLGESKDSVDTDIGDSGSPQLALLADEDGTNEFVATSITSRSQSGEDFPGSGSINTRLDVHFDWIDE